MSAAQSDAPPPHPLVRTPDDWKRALVAMGERPFRAMQVFQWIHRKNVMDAREMTELPVALRDRLAEEGLVSPLEVRAERRSLDDTRKLVVAFPDAATVETVLIPAVSGPGSAAKGESEIVDADAATADTDEEDENANAPKRRVTQCISTQVGCAMGCVFCASGVAGLKRHLGAHEIVAQVLEGRRRLDDDEQLRNVVFMGMGEPLHNYEATAAALRVLVRDDGIGLSSRRVTVSTSGLVPEIDRLGAEFAGQITLAVSLHATTDDARSALMPINKKHPLSELMAALRRYPLPKRRRITIEFTLVAGQNDSLGEAKRLAALLKGIPVKINLIPMNPIEASTLGPPDLAGVLAFQKVLLDAGYSCFVRRRRGDDVSAACGQLALLGAAPRNRRAFATSTRSPKGATEE